MELSYSVFISLLLLLPISTCTAHNYFINQICTKNFTNDNPLHDSINKTLSSLLAKTSLDGFGISSFGDGFFTLYGLSQCRGDLAADGCSSCITNATQNIRTTCPNSAEALIWYEDCFLRYDTLNFLGQPDTSYTRVLSSSLVATDPIKFNEVLMDLMYRMKAMTVGLCEKFGNYFDDVSKNLAIHATAGCTRDLEDFACRQCLDKITESILKYCKNHLDCYVLSNSCVLRYDVKDFLNKPVPLSPVVFSAGPN